MSDIIRTLEAIDKNRAEDLLLEKDLNEKLNFLSEHDLVQITDEKIELTPKGHQVRTNGDKVLTTNTKKSSKATFTPSRAKGKIPRLLHTVKGQFFQKKKN